MNMGQENQLMKHCWLQKQPAFRSILFWGLMSPSNAAFQLCKWSPFGQNLVKRHHHATTTCTALYHHYEHHVIWNPSNTVWIPLTSFLLSVQLTRLSLRRWTCKRDSCLCPRRVPWPLSRPYYHLLDVSAGLESQYPTDIMSVIEEKGGNCLLRVRSYDYEADLISRQIKGSQEVVKMVQVLQLLKTNSRNSLYLYPSHV